MKDEISFKSWMVFALAVCVVGFGAVATAEDETAAQAKEKIGVEGKFVRVAETDEGWVVLGYQTANESVGEEWMLLNVGMTVLAGQKGQKITRDQIKLVTPDRQVISLPTQEEYSKVRGKLAAMTREDDMMHESINYFPPGADQVCRIGFFSDPTRPMQGLAYDEVELNPQRACVGRLYFQVPGGIQYGNYNLDVQFANSIVRVPMKIMTKEEAKEFEKKWKEAEKEAKHKGHDH
jgi:hypothetical protein